MSEDIEAFKRTLRRIAVDAGNDNSNAVDCIQNFNNWVDWVENPESNQRTAIHGDYLRTEGARNIAYNLVRKEFRRKPTQEIQQTYAWLKWVGGLCAQNMVNASVNTETDRLFPTLYQPDVIFWRVYDSRKSVADIYNLPPITIPPTAKNKSKNKKSPTNDTNTSSSSSDSKTNSSSSSSSSSEIVGDMDTEERKLLGPPASDIDLLPKDINIDEFIELDSCYDFWPAGTYYAPKDTKPGWIIARAVEMDDLHTVVRMELLSDNSNEPNTDLWASFESDRNHFAPLGFFTGDNNNKNDKTKGSSSSTTDDSNNTYTDILYDISDVDKEWRSNLTNGKLIDAMDKNGKWYRAIIVDTDPNNQLTNSSSVFLPNETRSLPVSGQLRISFCGLNPSKDEWLHRCSERISHLNFRSLGQIGNDIEIHPFAELDEERNFIDLLMDANDENGIIADRILTPFILQKGTYLVQALGEFFSNMVGVRYTTHAALRQRLLNSGIDNQPHLPLTFWTEWIPVMGKLIDLFTKRGIQYIIEPLVNGCIRWVNNGITGEEMRALTKDQVDQLHIGLLRLTRSYNPVDVSSRISLEIILTIIERWLKSENTVKRRDALKLIQEIMEYTNNYQLWPLGIARNETVNKQGQPVTEYTRVPYIRNYTVKELAKWITDHNIIKDIFNIRHHHELVRNGGHIIRILADVNMLTNQDIRDIWLACEHTAIEDVQAAITMLIEIIPFLPSLITKQLFELVLLNGGTKFPDQTCRLLQNFALSQGSLSSLPLENQEKVVNDKNTTDNYNILNIRRALGSLYALSLGIPINQVATLILTNKQDPTVALTNILPTKSSEEKDTGFGSSTPTITAVSDAAQVSLLNALQDKRLAPYRLPYIRLCIRNIQHNIFITRSLTLLRGIIETYPSLAVLAATANSTSSNNNNGNKKVNTTGPKPPPPPPSSSTTDTVQLPTNLLPTAPVVPSTSPSKDTKASSTSNTNCTYTTNDIAVFVESLQNNTEKATLLGLDMTKSPIQAALILLHKDPTLPTTMKVTGPNIGAVVRKAVEQLATFNTLLSTGLMMMNTSNNNNGKANSKSNKSDTTFTIPEGPYLSDIIDLLQKEHDIISIFVNAISMFSKRGQAMATSMNMHTWADIHSDSKDNTDNSSTVPLARTISGNLDTSIIEATALLDDTHIPIINTDNKALTESLSKEMAQALSLLGYDPLSIQNIVDSSSTTVPFGNGIKLLLETIGYLTATSNIMFTKEQVITIWDTCIDRAITNTQRVTCLAWFLHGISSLSRYEGPRPTPSDITSSTSTTSSLLGLLFTAETAEYLFLERINTPIFTDGMTIDHTGFVIWRAFFIYYAGRQGAIQHGGTRLDDIGAATDAPKTTTIAVNTLGFLIPDPPLWSSQVSVIDTSLRRISDIEVVGMDTLWLLTLQASDSTVASDAVHLLTTLQQRVSESLAPRLAEFRRSYVRRCMLYIQNALQTYSKNMTNTEYNGWPWDGSGDDTLPNNNNNKLTATTPSRTSSNISSSTPPTLLRSPSLTSDTTSRTIGRPSQLVDRCISLLESLLDESEDEMTNIFEALRWLIAHITTLLMHGTASIRQEFLQSATLFDNLSIAREILTYSSHALDASNYLDSINNNDDLSQVPNSPTATARVLSSTVPTVKYTEAADQLDPDRTCTLRINFINVPLPYPIVETSSTKSKSSTESKESDSKESKEEDNPPPLPPTIVRLNGQINVIAGIHERVRDIVMMIAGMTGLPSRCLRIRFAFATNKEPRGAMLGRTLAEIGQTQSVFITVNAEAQEALDLQRIAFSHVLGDISTPSGLINSLQRLLKRAQAMPARLLASETQGFNTLFSLLDIAIGNHTTTNTIPTSTAAKVWRMLCRLPTSPQYLHAMLDKISGGGNKYADIWLSLLPTVSYSRFLYGTLLVRRLITPPRIWMGEGIYDSLSKNSILRYLPGKKKSNDKEEAKDVVIMNRILRTEAIWRTNLLQDMQKVCTSHATSIDETLLTYPKDIDNDTQLDQWRIQLITNGGLNHIFSELIRTLRVSPMLKNTEANIISSLRFVTLAIVQRYLVSALLAKEKLLYNHKLTYLAPRDKDANSLPHNYTGAIQNALSKTPTEGSLTAVLLNSSRSTKANTGTVISTLALEYQLPGFTDTLINTILQALPVDMLQSAILQYIYHEIMIKQINNTYSNNTSTYRLRILDIQSILRCLYVWSTLIITHSNLWSTVITWVPDTKHLPTTSTPGKDSFLRLILVLLLGPTISKEQSISLDQVNIGEDNITLQFQCAIALVLYTVGIYTPTHKQLPPGDITSQCIDGTTIHPHRWLLTELCTYRPTYKSTPTSGNTSVYFSLLEGLLRDVIETLMIPSTIPVNTTFDISSIGEGARLPRIRLPAHLRTLLKELLEQIAICPILETLSSVSEANKIIQQRTSNQIEIDDDDAAAIQASMEGPLPPPPPPSSESNEEETETTTAKPNITTTQSQSSSPITHTVDFTKRNFTSFRNTQLTRIRPLYSVIPMHPAFMSLGKAITDDTVRKALMTLVNAHPDTSILTSPKSLDNVPGAATEMESLVHENVRNISLEPVALEDDVVSPVIGVDHILIGTLRLATILVEMDPTVARTTAEQTFTTTSNSSKTILEILFYDCLFVDDVAHIVQSPTTPAATFSPSIIKSSGTKSASTTPATVTYHPLVLVSGSPPTGPKCKSTLARRAAFQLLTAFVRRSQRTMVTMLNILETQALQLYDSENSLQRLDTISRYGYKQNPLLQEGRSSAGYVGLRNLGSTCYMNSLLQQFFMMEPLRFGILSLLTNVESNKENMTLNVLNEERKNSVLYQLQRIFGHLELSDRRAYEPRDWTQAFKDWEGNPINVGEQQDAQEFLNMFLDKIENELKPTSRSKLIHQVLGLETREILYCTGGCGTVQVKKYPNNYCLSVEVSTGEMTSALDRLVSWEDIHGYECDACKQRTTLRKRSTLGNLGNTLILHLKRFSMDWEIMQPVKQNTFFEFPTTLNFQPYSYDVIARELTSNNSNTKLSELPQDTPRDQWQYELVGVVVHSGELTHGHYYSFIKERGLRANALMAERKGMEAVKQHSKIDASLSNNFDGRWLEFNDSLVKEWDINKLSDECFGGNMKTSGNNNNNQNNQITRNAYMLVYERKAPKPVDVEIESSDADICQSLLGTTFTGYVNPDPIPTPTNTTSSTKSNVLGFTFGKHGSASSSTSSASPVNNNTASITTTPPDTKQTLPLLPNQLVPRDSYGRGIMPSSIAAEIISDNGVFGRLYRQMDHEFASFMHSVLDTVGRQPSLIPHTSATPLAAPLVYLDDDDIDSSKPEESKKDTSTALVDFRTLVRPLFMFGVLPLARSSNISLVPHYMYNLCRLIGLHKEITDMIGFEFVDTETHVRTKPDKNKKEKKVPRTLSGRLVLDDNNLHHDSWYRTIILQGAPDIVRYAVARVFAMTLIMLLQSELPSFRPQAFRAFRNTNAKYRLEEANGKGTLLGNLLSYWMGSFELFDYCAAFGWRYFDPHFTALYDAARGGFGSGFPLQLHLDSTISTSISIYSSGGSSIYRALCRWSDGLPEHRIDYDIVKSLRSNPDYKILEVGAYGVATYYRFMVLGHRMRHAYIDRLGLTLLFDLFLQDNNINWPINRKRESMCNKLFTPTWTRTFDLLALLWRSCFMPNHGSQWPGAVSPFAVYLGPVRSIEHASLLHFLPTHLVNPLTAVQAVQTLPNTTISNTTTSRSNVLSFPHLSLSNGRRSSTTTTSTNTTSSSSSSSSSTITPAVFQSIIMMENKNIPSEHAYSAVLNGSTDAQIMRTYWKYFHTLWTPSSTVVPLGSDGRTFPIPPIPDPCLIAPAVLPAYMNVLIPQSYYDLIIQRMHASIPNSFVTDLIKARNEFKVKNPTAPLPGKYTVTLAGVTLSAPDVPELTDRPIELEMHREQTLCNDSKLDPGGRVHTLALDPLAPDDVQSSLYRYIVRNRNIYSLLLNKSGTVRSGQWPDMWGPNPDAVASIIGHRFAGLKQWNEKEKDYIDQHHFVMKSLDIVMKANYNPDYMHPIFMVMETLALQYETMDVHNNRIGEFIVLLYKYMFEAYQEKYIPVALECANEIARLFILTDRAIEFLLEKDWEHYQTYVQQQQQKGLLPLSNTIIDPPRGSLYHRHFFESTIISILMDIEQEGRNRVPIWQLALVDPLKTSYTESEIVASATAGAPLPGTNNNKTLSSSEAHEIPYRRYMTSLLLGNITNISHKDEVMLINQSNINPCLRATIALQRIERGLQAHGYTMLTKTQIEEIRKQRQEELQDNNSNNANNKGKK